MLRLGTSGWYYDHWVGSFYPVDLEKKHWLSFYTENFGTVEVNASFYRLPFKNMVKGWYNKAPEGFIFTFKAWRLITHQKKLKNIDALLDKFYSRIELVKEKLGAILFQLPPSLPRNDSLLEDFLEKLDPEKENVLEFRHQSWYNETIYDLLRDYDTAYCICSSPDFPEHPIATSDTAYIRWHGKEAWYRSRYSKEELKKWATEIRKLQRKTRTIYGYFNNDYQGYAPENCKELIQILKTEG